MGRSDPLDLDPVAQGEGVRRSNLVRPRQIVWLRSAPCEGAAALDAGGSIRGGAARELARVRKTGIPGVDSTRAWVWDAQCGMVNPPGA